MDKGQFAEPTCKTYFKTDHKVGCAAKSTLTNATDWFLRRTIMANTQTATKKSLDRLQSEMRNIEPAEMGRDVVEYLREYARENPESAALWCFGIGFVLGWKLKIW